MYTGIVVRPSGDPLVSLLDGEEKLYTKSVRRIGYIELETPRDFEDTFLADDQATEIALH
jgi:hypothetical protein